VLLLHDVDAPIIYERTQSGMTYSQRGRIMPHGVLGAMILRDVGFPDSVCSIVATHAVDSPFHSEATEAWVLHYADLFAADHALPLGGFTPVYRQKRH
jgi:HD-like signal output (HDOD) protein